MKYWLILFYITKYLSTYYHEKVTYMIVFRMLILVVYIILFYKKNT